MLAVSCHMVLAFPTYSAGGHFFGDKNPQGRKSPPICRLSNRLERILFWCPRKTANSFAVTASQIRADFRFRPRSRLEE
jgi:hypothetical protein